jgi:hypothetical protein
MLTDELIELVLGSSTGNDADDAIEARTTVAIVLQPLQNFSEKGVH